MPTLTEEVRKGLKSIELLTNPKLKKILQYYFDVNNIK